jgi:hypothetical protein
MDGAQERLFADRIGLISAAELAKLWGYAGPNDAFRVFCSKLSISHVPGRPGWFDPSLVRHRMNEAQGLVPLAQSGAVGASLVDQRRARRGSA